MTITGETAAVAAVAVTGTIAAVAASVGYCTGLPGEAFSTRFIS